MTNASTQNIENIKDDLSVQTSKITKLKGEILGLERRLNRKHNDLLKRIDEKGKVARGLESLQEEYQETNLKIKNQYLDLQKNARQLALEQTLNGSSFESLIRKRIAKKRLNWRLEQWKKLILRSQDLNKEVELLKQRYAAFNNIEETLRDLLQGLEGKKRVAAKDYLEAVEIKEGLEFSISKRKQKITQEQEEVAEIKPLFSLPLKTFVRAEAKNKGINFYYKEASAVLAPRGGKVVYSGNLSTVGQVMVIDHGDDLRSVLVGYFQKLLPKDKEVKKGEVLGYTLIKDFGKQSMYYELRQANSVKNALNWLPKSELKI